MSAYPFSAVVGHDDMRLALLLNAVSPAVGGVLVRGEKGTAKSTLVRSLAVLLPAVEVVPGCRFGCDPAAPDPECPDGPHASPEAVSRPARLVELPVGASEDRLVGSLDLERALTTGVTVFTPGLLATAHRGVLYVDEVNLLHDHLVDLLLDAAALGTSYVEREGVSVRHAARFLLVGTMNPEEGELRPQLLDRFGLTVEVAASRDPAVRAEVVRRRLAYEADPAGFAASWAGADAALAARVVAARTLLPRVVLGDAALRQVTGVCAAFDVDGMRGDLVTARAAVALAAWDGRTAVTGDDVRTAARLALPHRRRRAPFDAPDLDEDRLEQALRDADPDDGPPDDGPGSGSTADTGSGDADGAADPGAPQQGEAADAKAEPVPSGARGDATAPGPTTPGGQATQPAGVGATYRPRLLTVPGMGDGAAGRRSVARGSTGRTVGERRPVGGTALGALHLTATLRAAAPHQSARGRSGPGLLLQRVDLRGAVRERREGNLVLFAVDASGSMAARQRMRAVTGAVMSLLLDAYQRRDKVGLVVFRGADADVALAPTSSVEVAARSLAALRTGGRTPLSAGLLRSAEVLRVAALREPERRALLVVVTDGRSTSGPDPAQAAGLLRARGVASVVVDCETGPVRLGGAARLAAGLGGVCLRLDELDAAGLAGVVTDARGGGRPPTGRAA